MNFVPLYVIFILMTLKNVCFKATKPMLIQKSYDIFLTHQPSVPSAIYFLTPCIQLKNNLEQ